MNRKSYAILVAGGKGERMGSALPKQFLEIGGKPILRLTMEKFLSLEREVEIIVALPTAHKEYWREYCNSSGFRIRHILVSGGITRFHSVQNALAYVEDGALVAVHDGVRPIVSQLFLERMFAEASEKEAVIPVMPLTESLREYSDFEKTRSKSADRSRFVTVQTPQVFRSEILKEAYKQAFKPSFTDDASVVESAGYEISMVPGERWNLKITTPEDLQLAQRLL